MRSVVVVLPASMCAMIPMFRVFSSEYLRGMWKRAGCGGADVKNGPLGPARTATSGVDDGALSARGLHVREVAGRARAPGAARPASWHGSKGMRLLRDPDGAARALRAAAAGLAVAGVALLPVAPLAVVLRVHVPAVRADGRPVAATTLEATGRDRHGPALVLLAVVGLGLAGAALRGVRGTAAG